MNDDMIRVLRHLAEHFATPGVHRLNAPLEVPGLSFDDRASMAHLWHTPTRNAA